MRPFVVVSLVLLTAACSGDFGPGSRVEKPVELQIDARAPVGHEPQHPTVAPFPGGITVKGQLFAGNPCQDLSATAQRSERGELLLSITATAKNVPCVQVLGGFSYTATVRDLEPGMYHLTVVHATEVPGRKRHADSVLHTDVVVP
jgi:hypothetical protein